MKQWSILQRSRGVVGGGQHSFNGQQQQIRQHQDVHPVTKFVNTSVSHQSALLSCTSCCNLVYPKLKRISLGSMDASQNPKIKTIMTFRLFPQWNRKVICPDWSRIVLRSFWATLLSPFTTQRPPRPPPDPKPDFPHIGAAMEPLLFQEFQKNMKSSVLQAH